MAHGLLCLAALPSHRPIPEEESYEMLVLSRKRGEKIVLPQLGIELMVVEISGDRVRIGVAAPPEITVYREEIWHRIRKEQETGLIQARREKHSLAVGSAATH
jgi:carbon storage regulator